MRNVSKSYLRLHARTYGRDRYDRRYWCLRYCGGVYVQGSGCCDEVPLPVHVLRRRRRHRHRDLESTPPRPRISRSSPARDANLESHCGAEDISRLATSPPAEGEGNAGDASAEDMISGDADIAMSLADVTTTGGSDSSRDHSSTPAPTPTPTPALATKPSVTPVSPLSSGVTRDSPSSSILISTSADSVDNSLDDPALRDATATPPGATLHVLDLPAERSCDVALISAPDAIDYFSGELRLPSWLSSTTAAPSSPQDVLAAEKTEPEPEAEAMFVTEQELLHDYSEDDEDDISDEAIEAKITEEIRAKVLEDIRCDYTLTTPADIPAS